MGLIGLIFTDPRCRTLISDYTHIPTHRKITTQRITQIYSTTDFTDDTDYKNHELHEFHELLSDNMDNMDNFFAAHDISHFSFKISHSSFLIFI